MGKYFDEGMTSYYEARMRFWKVLEGKSKEEEEEIMKEYREVVARITAERAKLRAQGWIIND